MKTSQKNLEIVEKVFCWSKYDKLWWNKIYKNYKKKVIVTGNPAILLWLKKFEKYFLQDIQNIKKKFKKYFLVVSNFPNVSRFNFKIEDFINFEKKFSGRIRNKKDLIYRKKFYRDDIKRYFALKNFVKDLALNYPSRSIIIRRHPAETMNIWNEFKNYKNIYINSEGSISPLVRGSEAIIHSGCTTGIEAYLSKKVTFVLEKFSSVSHKKFNNKLGYKIKGINDFKKELKGIEKNKHKYFNRHKDNLVNKIFDISKNNNYQPIQKILNEIKKINIKKTQQKNIEIINLIKKIKIKTKKIIKYDSTNSQYKLGKLNQKELNKIRYKICRYNKNFKHIKIKNYFHNLYIIEK